MSSLSEAVTMTPEDEHVDIIDALTSELDSLRVAASNKNHDVDGLIYSNEIVTIHNLVKEHRLLYRPNENPPGKWVWDGLREIKRKAGPENPAFTMPDGVATFYGNFNYGYAVTGGDGKTTVINHDVIAMSPVILDAKARASPRKSNSGVYGVDWWNVYIPAKLLERLSDDIKTASGLLINQEGIIMDQSQRLASVTINIRNEKQSPDITMVQPVPAHTETSDDGQVREVPRMLQHESMGSLKDIMSDGGEEDLIGGVAFFSIGVSCKGSAGSEPPPAGSPVKLSMKMKAFHALSLIDGGIRRITYHSKSDGLSYS